MSTAYCPTCRTYFHVDATPPYGVIHKSGIFEMNPGTGESVEKRPVTHLHPITREPLQQVAPTQDDPHPLAEVRS